MAGYRSRPSADEKGPRDLVTEFDRRSEALVGARLAAATPAIPVIGEELSGDDRHRRGLAWYVDPLDGTTNFVHGHPFFCVAIGLAADDVPLVGAVDAPALGVAWSGEVGVGASRNGEPCRVSATAELGDALVATGFPPVRDRAPADNFAAFVRVKRSARAVRRCGSAAIDLCMVADGTYDAYWERRLHAWDTIAASAIALGAGARVTALDGGPPDYHVGHLVVSNGRVHEALVAAVAEAAR
ncbi:MAG: inositol monophosphatase [Myxococcales bacterium]|nr:inositol monophosphatase [Myxococcales bacterium]